MTTNNNHKDSNIYTHHRNYLDLCQQYVIAGWLTSEQYRTVVVQPMQQMEDLNEQEASIQMERIAEQIQYIISKAQQQKSYNNTKEEEEEDLVLATTTAFKSTSNNQPTRHNMNNINPNQHHVTWVDQQQQQQQQQVRRSITSEQKENDNSGIFTIPHEFYQKQHNATFSIKELFVEMCFFARLGYIQPPCCLHCTYKNYYNTSTNNINRSKQSANNSKKQKCTLPVVWRKDTSIVLHPDTIASNIMIVPCYIVREVILLHHQQSKSEKSSSAMIPIQHIVNGTGGSNDQGTSNSKSDQSLSRQYQYDPVNKIIVTA